MVLASFGERTAAEAALEDMASHVPGKYFVWHSASGEVVAWHTATRRGKQQVQLNKTDGSIPSLTNHRKERETQ